MQYAPTIVFVKFAIFNGQRVNAGNGRMQYALTIMFVKLRFTMDNDEYG